MSTSFHKRLAVFSSWLLLGLMVMGGMSMMPVKPVAAQVNEEAVTPLAAQVTVVSSTWVAVWAPFADDSNGNSYARFEGSSSPNGPWSLYCGNGQPGESDWRHCAMGNLSANSDYYVRVTAVDPDGVNGEAVQIIGPVRTAATATNSTEVGTAVAIVKDTHILVTLPISQDANRNSTMTVEVAPSATGPWTRKCGVEGNFAPKLCRLHGLTQGTEYWIRTTIQDGDGTTGSTVQIVGPIMYTGMNNLALGKSISTIPGWGCCTNPLELLNGRIQDDSWMHGFAWPGGLAGWAGGAAGWKVATIDLGDVQTVARVDVWTHEFDHLPLEWRVEVSSDNVTYAEVFAAVDPVCRTETEKLDMNWRTPRCAHQAVFAPTDARYVRYSFNDRTILDGLHGWLQEIEVFGPATPPTLATQLIVQPPAAGDLYPGDSFTLDVDLENTVSLYAAEALCSADPSVITPQSAVFGDFFDPVHRLIGANQVDAAAGTWLGAISQQNPAAPLNGNGRFAILQYIATAPGSTAVSCEPLLADRDGFALPVTAQGTAVTILPFATLAGTVNYQGRNAHDGVTVTAVGPITRTAATGDNGAFTVTDLRGGDYAVMADAARYLPACTNVTLSSGQNLTLTAVTLRGGDANDDGEINIGDATLLGANFGLTTPPADARADINGDGRVNVQDLAIMGGNYGLTGCQNW